MTQPWSILKPLFSGCLDRLGTQENGWIRTPDPGIIQDFLRCKSNLDTLPDQCFWSQCYTPTCM